MHVVRYKKAMNEKGIVDYNEQVRALVGEEKWKQLETWCSSTTEMNQQETKATQVQKFERLQAKQHLVPQLDKDKLVKNLSSRNLTEKEKDVLALGLNFAMKLRQIPTHQIIAATESTATQLDKETAQQLRHKVSSFLSTAKPPRSNLDKQQRESVRSLRDDENIVILPADKGNATVILSRKDYVMKMENLLEDEAYKKVTCDPTSRMKKRISTALNDCEQKGYITTKQRMHLAHQFSSSPQIYGLPKVDKVGVPLRPIVAAIGSPPHLLAKELTRIRSPLAGKGPSHVRNSANFVQRIRQTPLAETDIVISFDVVSLFTNVPVDEALLVIAEGLQQDTTLEERTSIPIPDLCLESTYSQFGKSFFEQVKGADPL